MNNYDLIVVGSGPGGYAGAIRASQLGLKVAIVEAAELGGVCLNWGCIPTKALLKSASVYEYAKHAGDYGVEVAEVRADLEKIVERSRGVASTMSKGIEFLMKKNNIDVHLGRGVLTSDGDVMVGGQSLLKAKSVILATGARPRALPSVPVDGVKVLNSRHALVLKQLPASMVVIGSGAIGAEFASFFNTLGTKVTIVEFMSEVAPLEDQEISKQLDRAFRKAKMAVMTSTTVTGVDTSGDGCKVTVTGKKGE